MLKTVAAPQQLHEAKTHACGKFILWLTYPGFERKELCSFQKSISQQTVVFHSDAAPRECGSRSPELECRVRLWRSYVLLRFTRVYSSAKDWSERDLE
jgi:hypothetical protein